VLQLPYVISADLHFAIWLPYIISVDLRFGAQTQGDNVCVLTLKYQAAGMTLATGWLGSVTI